MKENKEYFEDDTMSNRKSQAIAGSVSTKQQFEHKRTCKKAPNSKRATKSHSPTKFDPISETENMNIAQKCCCESGNCIKNLKDLLDREVEYRQVHVSILIFML